jgi:hypothetical protein
MSKTHKLKPTLYIENPCANKKQVKMGLYALNKKLMGVCVNVKSFVGKVCVVSDLGHPLAFILSYY